MRNLLAILLLSITCNLFGEIIFVSDRLDFTDPDNISSASMKREIVLAPPYSSTPILSDRWREAIEGKEIAILIHGYNNDYDEAVQFCTKMIENSEHLYDVFVCYLWPGGDHRLEYLEARSRAIGLLPERLLSLTKELTWHGKYVDIIAHSMGCRLTLEMMQFPSNVFLRNVFLMAPAVDDEALQTGEIYHHGSNKCLTMFIFHSQNDDVLKWAYPIAELDRALGYLGPENHEELPEHIFQINCSDHIDSHGDYIDSNFIFNTIEDILDLESVLLTHIR